MTPPHVALPRIGPINVAIAILSSRYQVASCPSHHAFPREQSLSELSDKPALLGYDDIMYELDGPDLSAVINQTPLERFVSYLHTACLRLGQLPKPQGRGRAGFGSSLVQLTNTHLYIVLIKLENDGIQHFRVCNNSRVINRSR